MNLYLCQMLHLIMSILFSCKDIRPFLLSKSRQPMATLMAITIFSANCTIHTIWFWGEIDMPHQLSTSPITWSPILCALFVLHFILCSVKVSRWWRVTRFTQLYVHMYMFCPYVISTPYQLLEEYKWGLSKDTFSHAILQKTLHLREMNKDTIAVYHNCIS
jgi:hypothetical protein